MGEQLGRAALSCYPDDLPDLRPEPSNTRALLRTLRHAPSR